MVSSKTGLPVSVFRLCSPDGKEMFDLHTMEKYKITYGSSIQLHVWDGWGDLLGAATQGHTKKVYKNASSDDQVSLPCIFDSINVPRISDSFSSH